MGPMFANYLAARSEVVAAIDRIDPETMAANNGAPSSYAFATDAARVQRSCIRSRVQLGFLAVSRWDTHANQGASSGQLASLFLPFAQGISALARGLGPPMRTRRLWCFRSSAGLLPRMEMRGQTTATGIWCGSWAARWPAEKFTGSGRELNGAALHGGRDLPVTGLPHRVGGDL